VTKVSAIIPAYNQGAYLREAVRSLLDQTYPDFEVIVVDDGSTDDTCEVARSFADDRIHYVYQENRGLSGARNTGIRHSQGEYLTYLDSDDLFLPEKLDLLVAELESHPEIGLVAGQAIPIDEHGNRIGKMYAAPLPEPAENLLLGNPLHVGSVLVRGEWQKRAGFFDETLRSYEDWDMWLRLVRLGCRTGWVPKPVSLYRFHIAQMTRNSAQMTAATFAVLDKTFQDQALPESWLALRDKAYSQAHLRATASFYSAKDYPNAQAHLTEAVRLNPDLLAGNAQRLADFLFALADSPKNPNPLAFLENIYHHLPGGLETLRSRRRKDLGQVAVQLAFEAYQRGDMEQAQEFAQRAVYYQPSWLTNRGVVSILVRSTIHS